MVLFPRFPVKRRAKKPVKGATEVPSRKWPVMREPEVPARTYGGKASMTCWRQARLGEIIKLLAGSQRDSIVLDMRLQV